MNLLFALLFPSHYLYLYYTKMAYYTLSKSLTLSLHYCKGFFLQQVPKKNFSVSYTFILLLNDTNFYYKIKGDSFQMAILQGLALLLVVLCLFTLFSYRAPYGMKAMGALANAAIASFLIEAFHRYIGGEMFHNDFYNQ